jgi:helix-turn-helix protein
MRERGDHLSDRSPSVLMGKALSHPMRVRILTGMNAPERRLSASDFSDETGLPLSTVAYHFRKLHKYGCVELVDTFQRRGATEHVYRPTKRAMAWTREWEDLGPHVRQNLAASALRASVEAIGEAIDQGTFEGLPDPILAWDVMRVDDEAEKQVHMIWERALVQTLKVAEACDQRLADAPETPTRLLGYLMSTFEAPERPEASSA